MELLDKKGLTTVWAAIKNTFTSKSDADEKYAKKNEALLDIDIDYTEYDITINTYHVDNIDTGNTTIDSATSTYAGVMTAADKNKLDGIASGANNYTLPTASAIALGGIKTNFAPIEGDCRFKVITNEKGDAYVSIPGLYYGNDHIEQIEFKGESDTYAIHNYNGVSFRDAEGTETNLIEFPFKSGTFAITSDCGLLVMGGDIVNNNISFNGYKQNVLISASGNYNISNWYNSSPVGSVMDIYPFADINGAITADNKYIFQTMDVSSSGLPIIVTKKSINLSSSHHIRLIHISGGVYVCISVLGY